MIKLITNFFKKKIAVEEKEQDSVDPYTLVCPTCLGNCGQCGITGIKPTIEDGHWIYYKDLKKYNNSKGTGHIVGIISSMINSK